MKAHHSTTVKVLTYNAKKELLFSGKKLSDFAKNWKGPVYIYSLKGISQRTKWFLKEVGGVLKKSPQVCYAMKANSHPQVMRAMRTAGCGADVVSLGEIQKARRAGFTPTKILFSGVGKTAPEISAAIKMSVGQINVESLPELIRIGEISKKIKKPANVGLRINPEVNPDTHPYISTGLRENKFGIEMSQMPEAIEILRRFPLLQFRGLSLHIGSQLFDFGALEEAIVKALDVDSQFEKVGFVSKSFDVGGGIGIQYQEDAEMSDQQNLQRFVDVLKRTLGKSEKSIMFEPGRFLVGRFGVLLTEIQYLKKTSHKNFIICDTGMNHLLRPALYGAYHRILPIIERNSVEGKFDFVGPICESSDVLGVDRVLNTPEAGDILCLADTGAYGFSMANQYNSFALPKEIVF